jgi:hypothetical protein
MKEGQADDSLRITLEIPCLGYVDSKLHEANDTTQNIRTVGHNVVRFTDGLRM